MVMSSSQPQSDRLHDGLEFTSNADTRKRLRIMLLDNVDSFTYNLKYLLQDLGIVKTFRNDVELNRLVSEAEKSDLLVLSPGPGTPNEAGNLIALIQCMVGKVPMFGICLGHQAMVEAFAGDVTRAPAILHGKTSSMAHQGEGLFAHLPSPLNIARYHSLVASHVPENFTVTARVEGQVMAIEDKDRQLYGVQFHPESILTTYGDEIFKNVIHMIEC